MEIIKHRINRITELNKLKPSLGAEIDLRSSRGDIILHHDPHQFGDRFRDFIKVWAETSAGCNTKSFQSS